MDAAPTSYGGISTGSFNLCGVGNGAIIAGSAVVGLLGGGGLGAAIPIHPTIYRVDHH